MKIVAIKNSVVVVVGRTPITLVTLSSPAAAMKAVKWTRTKETATEGASAILDYCKEKGMTPKGRGIAKKYCPALAGLRADYK